ncbi:hypothetical protein [Bacillus sp. FJAT-44742]|uniref:hypothetical protein n=1 Tax=Bacillus sp. FJAT-44742 TaxID=2014005 RepID=UPI0012FF1CAB|nr:hypothetical protein [Bacillus sp. FJAT-44742]
MIRKEAGKIEWGIILEKIKDIEIRMSQMETSQQEDVKSLVEMVCFEKVRKTGGIE